jgi:hypothetical protein
MQTPAPAPTGATTFDPNEIPFVSLESGADSPLHKLGVFVFQTSDQFKTYLAQIQETKLKKPDVDWTNQEIIAVQAKGLSTDGNSIKVRRIHRTGPGQITMEVLVLKTIDATPAEQPLNFSSKTAYPFAIIQTQKFDGKIQVQVLSG